IRIYRTIGKQLEILKNNSEFSSQKWNLFLFYMVERKARHCCITLHEFYIAIKRFKQGAFAGSCFTDEVNKFSFFHFKVNIGKNQASRLKNIDVGEFDDNIHLHLRITI